jgi:hypothetical protein
MGPQRARITLGAVEQIFRDNSWRYVLMEGILLTGFASVPMFLCVEEDHEILRLEVPVAPGRGMPGHRPARLDAERDIGIYLSALNYELALGSFTRDHRDGEIRYDSSIPVSSGMLATEQLLQLIEVGVAAVSVRGPTILELLAGRVSLQHALAEVDDSQGDLPAMVL